MDGRLPPTSAAFQDAMRSLRAELETHIVDPASDRKLRDALARAALEAREAGLKAEHLVIAFRQLWDGARPGFPRATPAYLDDLRWRLVEELLTDYYARGSGDADRPIGR